MRKALVLASFCTLTGLVQPAHASVGDVVKKVAKAITSRTHDRGLHRLGAAYHGTMHRYGGDDAVPVIVRLSHGAHTDPAKRNIMGLAIKVLAHEPGHYEKQGATIPEQDILLVTAKGEGRIASRIPKIAGGYGGEKFSSITSFESRTMYPGMMGHWMRPIQTGAITTQLPAFATQLDAWSGEHPAVSAPSVDRMTFQLQMHQPGREIEPVLDRVTVRFDKPLSAAESATLRFTPMNDGLGVRPVGYLNKIIRRFAYEGSQVGRGVLKE